MLVKVLELHKKWRNNENGGKRAVLYGADLRGVKLCGADLSDTVLCRDNTPNADVKGFEQLGEYVIGYRTRKAGHIDKYRDGRFYSADIFSTCNHTECHPGLYLWPTLILAREWSSGELIKVRTKPSEVHHAGNKWQCRWFEVLGGVE